MPGVFLRSRDGLTGFDRGPTLFTSDMRHSAVRVDGDTLTVFYTIVGEAPERVVVSTIDLSGDWMSWRETPPQPVIEPEHDFEGADLPLVPSMRGEITARARQLRDPALFEDDGRQYLREALAEVLDALHYCAAELVRLDKRRQVPGFRTRRVYVCHPYRNAPSSK